jgi:isopentenyl phosphate kinase
MDTDIPNSKGVSDVALVVHGGGSVAHQIIGEFLSALAKCDGYEEIATNLKPAIFEMKPTELALRIAIHGEELF